MNKKKINNPSYRQLLLSAFDYFNFEKNFDALKNLSKFTEDKRAAELIDIISDFYLNLSDKSKTELKKANEHFVSVITKIANDPTIQTLIKLKAIEALGDYYSDSKITASIEYYNAIENDASADTETRLRISLKKARIYAKLEQKENYFTVIMNIVKNSGVNYFYLRKSLKEFITQIKFENSGKPAVDVIKNFEALAEKYKEVPQLCYAILDEAAAYAFESNERYYSKKILERIIEYFPKNKDYISEAYIKSGDIAYADEDFENSLKYYKRSIEYGVDIPEKKQRALNQYKLKYLAKGEFELKIKDYEKAYKTFFNLVEFDKSYIPAHRQYIKTGVMLGKLNELSAVYEEFKKIIISPHEKSAFNYASALLMTYQPNYKENLNTALRLVNAAIKIRREESCYYQLAGWINEQIELQLGKANRLERAVNLYKIGLGLINDNDLTQAAEFNLNIANAYYNMKNYEFAYKYYLESLTFENYFQNINKNILLVLYANLAHTGYYTNNFNIAEEYYKKAIFISSDTQQKQSFYERLSLMHYSAGNFTGAIDALKSSADLISGGYNPLKQYYINRAVLLYTLNRFKESAGLSMLEKLRAKKTLIGALTAVEDFYKKEYSEKTVQKNGFLDFKFNFSGSESDNSEGLDSITEQKFIYMLASDLYFSYYDNQNAIEIFRKRLNLIPDGVTPEKSPGLALEKSILLNNLSSLQIKAGDYSGAFLNLKNSIQLASDLNEEFGVYNNLFLMLEILNYYEEKDKKDFINTYLQFYKMYFKKIKIRVDSFDLVLSNAAAYYNEMLYKYEINELNNLFTDTISFYNRYISAYAKHIAAGRIIAEAIETIKLKRKAEPLLNALAVCAGVNYAAINDTLYNIKLIADSDLIQLSESVRWLNFQSAKNYDEMRKYEQNLLQYTLETAKFNGYNFLSKDILRQFYNRLFAVCKAEKDYISAAIYADHYLALLKYLTLNTKKNIFSLQFAGENDIAEIQSILNDSQSIGIFINLENDTLAFVINNSEILECTGTILSNNFLWLVNCSSPFIFQSKNSNSVFISSLTAFLKASSNRSIFFEKKAIINSSDAADISIDTDIDALFLKCGIELNNRDLYASKLKFAGGTISLDMLRDYNFRNVNYCEIDALLNKNIKSNDFNIFCSFFNDAGISSVRFKSVEALVSQNKNKDLITAGCAQYSYAEMTAIALEKSADLISAAADEYKKNNFNNALRNIQKLIELRVVLKFDKISLKKYYSFAVNSAYKFQDYSNCIKYQLEFISQLNAASIEYGRALYNLGIFYSLNEDFDSSAITLKKALQVYADDTQYVNKTIEELSKTAEFSGNYSSAADYIEGVIKQTENTDDLGRQYSRLGFLYYGRLNEYSTALEYFQKALRYFEKSKNKKNICRSLIDIGLVYMQIGDFIGAINNFDSALILAKKNSDTHIISEILLNTANIRWFEGDYKKAIEHIFEAVTFAETNKDEERKYLAYNTLGLIYWTLNNYDKAIFYLEKSLEISERLKKYNDISSTYNNIGIVCRSIKNFDSADYYFQKALQIDKKIKSRWALGYDYRNIGILQAIKKDLSGAAKSFAAAYSYSNSINDAVNIAKTSLELGSLNVALNNTALAFTWFDTALKFSRSANLLEVQWRALYGKGKAAFEKDLKSGLAYFKEAAEIVDKMRASLKIEELKNSFLIDKKDLYETIIKTFVTLNQPVQALEYLERFKSRSFIDLLGNFKIKFNNKSADKLYAYLYELRRQENILSAKLENSGADTLNITARLRELKTAGQETLLKMKLLNPEFESLVNVVPITASEISQFFDTHMAAVEYFFTGESLFIWVIEKNNITFKNIIFKKNFSIHSKINDFIKRIQNKAYIEDISEELFALLFEPIEPLLRDKKYICIIPFDMLHYLSFAALKNKNYYVVDKYSIFYLPSLSLVKYVFNNDSHVLKTVKSKLKILAVGNPDLGDLNFDLPLSGYEAQSIKFEFDNVDELLKRNAKKKSIIENIGKYDVIHIAAHGEFDSINPLFSALKLAGDNINEDDLKALDIFNLKINAELVTLSACQSGIGKLAGGDEIIGLNRAFFFAGTKSIVSSMWRIDDLTTALLMKNFYRNYLNADKISSLRAAQLKVKADYPHPVYWSGIFLSGEYK